MATAFLLIVWPSCPVYQITRSYHPLFTPTFSFFLPFFPHIATILHPNLKFHTYLPSTSHRIPALLLPEPRQLLCPCIYLSCYPSLHGQSPVFAPREGTNWTYTYTQEPVFLVIASCYLSRTFLLTVYWGDQGASLLNSCPCSRTATYIHTYIYNVTALLSQQRGPDCCTYLL